LTVVAIIQARMGSSRLPGKVLRPLGPRPVLGWVVRAAQAARGVSDVVVATSEGLGDDPVAEFCRETGVRVVRGSPEDVLARFEQVLDEHPHHSLVRLTADCPFLDPTVIDMAVGAFIGGDVDYLSTVTPRTLPRGLDVEVLSSEALRKAGELATGVDRVHVTSYVYARPFDFRIAGLTFFPQADDLRLTLDTVTDGVLLDHVVDDLGDEIIPWRTLVRHLRENPQLVALNADVVQKRPEEG
jgi:spore coat polysaccharide biosynthesis protein SpsF